jgi:hypothetical protein
MLKVSRPGSRGAGGFRKSGSDQCLGSYRKNLVAAIDVPSGILLVWELG